MTQPLANLDALADLSDEQLATRAQAGCRTSFAALAQRMRPRLVHYLWQRTGRWADAEDIAQDAITRAMQKLDRYDSRWKFSTWLFTIGHRLAIDLRRRRKDTVSVDALGPVPDGREAPGDQLADAELHDNLWATASRVLNDDQYATLWLRYGEDMPIKDIAKVVGKTAIAVRVALSRARSKLAAHLESIAPDPATPALTQPATTGGGT